MTVAPDEQIPGLRASCPQKDLNDAVQTVAHAVSGRNPLPILSHIMIKGEEGGLRLMATDLELGISCKIPAEVETLGALTAPSKTLSEVLANLKDKSDVAISVDRSHTVQVNCQRSIYTIVGLPWEDYPNLPEIKENASFSIPQSKLREIIRQTAFAVSQDEGRRILTGIYIVFDGENATFVATDTHRLAKKTCPVLEGIGSQNIIVPSRAMNELNRLLTDGEGAVKIVMADNQVQFILPGESGIQIVSRLIEGQYPNYQRVIPQEFDKKIKIPTADLLQAVRRASIVARENAHRVVMRSNNGNLEITAESRLVGKAFEEIEIEQTGEMVEIAFNCKYLMDVVSQIDTDFVTLEMTESLKPGVMRPVPHVRTEAEAVLQEEADYLCVLMPMQIV